MGSNYKIKIFAQDDDSVCLILDLVELRKKRRLSQREVAEKMGISHQRMQQLENQQNCTIDILAAWARALGRKVTIDTL